MKLAYITAISLPCKGGTNDPTKHAAFRSHPSRPNKAPKKTTPVARNELTSSPIKLLNPDVKLLLRGPVVFGNFKFSPNMIVNFFNLICLSLKTKLVFTLFRTR